MARKKSAAKKAREAAQKEEFIKQEEIKESTAHKDQISDEESDYDDSESENEDDFGELITNEVESGISNVLNAIKNNDPSLLNPEVRFFEDPEKAVTNLPVVEKHKPVYLKDYHRQNILEGKTHFDEDETVDGLKSYATEQREEKAKLLSEIADAFSDDDSDDLLVKKERDQTSAPSRALPQDEEGFLEAFVNDQAWIPKKGDKVINLDTLDNEEFDDAAETFEHAYNFRFEEANSAEIISYARNQATLRRSETTSRRAKREREREEKRELQEKVEAEVSKKKKEKVNKLTDVMQQIKNEYGADINEEMAKKLSDTLLDKDFDDSQWDQVLGEMFNDEFYDGKPTWDDDIDMGDIPESQEEGDAEPPKKKSKKEKLAEKKSTKKEAQNIKKLAEQAIDEHKMEIKEEVEEEARGRTGEREVTFKYREVSPESFGLSTREILYADDKDLNDLISIKKYAPYRPKEKVAKDRRKLKRGSQLKDWRKKVFKGKKVDEEK